ncbi:hypothetical protein KAJ83_09775 [Marivibrio halodurans]|uniref:Uncharacterized protein n=1 Tax=Marivibrio halodurans TaxID=2039722 RepID=A0A8J7RYZ7_9PROT|nr:hypothetical protein [Marivibrio halodurans]MBP5857297.1 hypothetical protein [Marivibrio halodurans]
MTLPVFPVNVGIEEVGDFDLLHRTEHFPSSLTSAERIRGDLTPRWTVALRLGAMTESEWRRWSAFVVGLAGASGLMYYTPTHAARPQFGLPGGLPGGTPVVAGAGQLGRSLITTGWPAGQTVLHAGDFFCFDNLSGIRELKLLTADASSDGAGAATLAFAPPIRRAPADGAAIVIDGPSCAMRAIDDKQGALTITRNRKIGRASFHLIESFVGAAS